MPSLKALQQPPCQTPMVAVQICDPRKKHSLPITHIPLVVLQAHAPTICHLLEPDLANALYCLPIRLPWHPHVQDIEHPGLTHLLSHWASSAPNPAVSSLPRPSSLSDAVPLYRALQLLQDPRAEILRARLMRRLRAQPATEHEVQTIWWAFQWSPEWADWLDGLAYNLMRFGGLRSAPQGTSILLFIETELGLLDGVQAERVVAVFERHADGVGRVAVWQCAVDWVVRRVCCGTTL